MIVPISSKSYWHRQKYRDVVQNVRTACKIFLGDISKYTTSFCSQKKHTCLQGKGREGTFLRATALLLNHHDLRYLKKTKQHSWLEAKKDYKVLKTVFYGGFWAKHFLKILKKLNRKFKNQDNLAKLFLVS